MAEKAECGSSTSQIEARVEGCYRVSDLAEDCVKAASRCVSVLLRIAKESTVSGWSWVFEWLQ